LNELSKDELQVESAHMKYLQSYRNEMKFNENRDNISQQCWKTRFAACFEKERYSKLMNL